MYDILTLNDKKVAELKEVAQEFNIEKIDKFKKQELIYKILEAQAVSPATNKKSEDPKPEEKKARNEPRKRPPRAEKPEAKKPEVKEEDNKETEEKPEEKKEEGLLIPKRRRSNPVNKNQKPENDKTNPETENKD